MMIILIMMSVGNSEASEPNHQFSKIALACPRALPEMTTRKLTKHNFRVFGNEILFTKKIGKL